MWVGTTNGGRGSGSVEDPSHRAARRLQDLLYRPAASRQVLPRGRGLHDVVSSPLATSIYTRTGSETARVGRFGV